MSQPSTPSPGTPTTPSSRPRRAEEKAELSQLNKRLELYIVNQRERDAERDGLLRQIEELRASKKAEIEQLRISHQVALNREREQVEHLQLTRAKLEEEKNRQGEMIKQLKAEILAQKSYRQGLEDRYEKLSQELQGLRTELVRTQEDYRRVRESLEHSEHELSETKAELETLRSRYELALGDLSAARAEADTLKKDLMAIRAETSSTIDKLTMELSSKESARNALESELRKEFGKQLKELLEIRSLQYSQEKDQLIAKCKEEVDAVSNNLQRQLEESLRQYGDLLQANKELEKMIKGFRDQSPKLALEKKIMELETQLAERERKIRELHISHSADLQANTQELKTQISAFTARLTQLESELREKNHQLKEEAERYRDLFDVKIALDMEIKAYRLLIEAEEDRLGVANVPESSKRRKLQPEFDADQKEVRITELDPEQGKLLMKNEGLGLVSLAGWQLRNNGGSRLHLPSTKLVPGELLTVWLLPEGAAPDGGLVWKIDPRSLDLIELVAPDGVVTSEVKIEVTDI